jgi:hypothetical protein
MLYCGYAVADDGTITGDLSPACISPPPTAAAGAPPTGMIPGLLALGVRPELVLNSGNCSIAAYRALWANATATAHVLVSLANAVGAAGFNLDLEPQADNCAGPGTGEPADALAYAAFLATARPILNAAGLRLTVDVCDWSPVLSNYTALAPVADRLFDMETYNAASFAQWLGYYGNIVNGAVAPRSAVGIGLGCWVDSSTNGTWSVMPQSGAQRVGQVLADGIPELAMFRLVPVTGADPPAWPEGWWWDALALYMAGAGAVEGAGAGVGGSG